jgi:hypothetical protein
MIVVGTVFEFWHETVIELRQPALDARECDKVTALDAWPADACDHSHKGWTKLEVQNCECDSAKFRGLFAKFH